MKNLEVSNIDLSINNELTSSAVLNEELALKRIKELSALEHEALALRLLKSGGHALRLIAAALFKRSAHYREVEPNRAAVEWHENERRRSLRAISML